MGLDLFTFCILFALWKRSILALLILAPIGALAKETFIINASVAVFTWLIITKKGNRSWIKSLIIMASFSLLALGSYFFVRYLINGFWEWPWEVLQKKTSSHSLLDGFKTSFLHKGFWYGFAWLLPLALIGFRQLPRLFWLPGITSCLSVIFLGTVHHVWGYV